ncbi:LuxR family transcriptional regulator [Solimonas sp. K1W22B-7]|uniref:helix-turn-helix domain-containing protein n=1 Tax=Solimonas sp. K1W22B-7 TaxID=2303331 RepID=UPI000E3320AA|nr:helix-turn-helix transcriptional regulator [Solimonas sp. K1W22B-7]AXQ30586.1 LuxR family transcriptional regulator [Solimonas sp. K1W22B-7]
MNSQEFPIEPLTTREQQVMACLMRALSASQTASVLGVSINTIKFHRRNIYAKLGATCRRVAVEAYCRIDPAAPA